LHGHAILDSWYFFWHYHAIEDMGAIVFSEILKLNKTKLKNQREML